MPPPDPNSSMENLTKVSTIGTNFAFSVVGMGVIGFGLDYFARSSPKWLIGCLTVGLIGGGYRFIRDALAANKQAAAQAARRKPVYNKVEADPEPAEEADSDPAPTDGPRRKP